MLSAIALLLLQQPQQSFIIICISFLSWVSFISDALKYVHLPNALDGAHKSRYTFNHNICNNNCTTVYAARGILWTVVIRFELLLNLNFSNALLKLAMFSSAYRTKMHAHDFWEMVNFFSIQCFFFSYDFYTQENKLRQNRSIFH